MAIEIMLLKTSGNSFSPADQGSLEESNGIKIGATVKATVTQPRNLKFHKKFFALLNLGFEHWHPEQLEWQGIKASKSFEVYREQVTILAGYREVTYNLDGSVKVKAKSISFTKMDDLEFQKLYKSVFLVIWNKVISQCPGWTEDEMNRVLGHMENFA